MATKNGSSPVFTWDANIKLDSNSIGSKFLIIEKTTEPCSLNALPAFFIKKVIDNIAGGEVIFCKKQLNGTLLVKTKNEKQAAKIAQLTSFNNENPVKVSLHRSLNYSMGVIYTNEFRGMAEEEILPYLQPQGVTQIKKILKKQENVLKETGLSIITFESNILPDELKIGYEVVRVRKYIRAPMQCNNCHKFGHTAKWCKSARSCINCSNEAHTNEEAKERCILPATCINCKDNELPGINHSPRDKKCPIFLQEKEIQAIRTDRGVSRRIAMKIFQERFPENNNNNKKTNQTTNKLNKEEDNSSSNNNGNNGKTNNEDNKQIESNGTRKLLSYSDIINLPEEIPTTSKSVFLVPLSTSKRSRRALQTRVDKNRISRKRAI